MEGITYAQRQETLLRKIVKRTIRLTSEAENAKRAVHKTVEDAACRVNVRLNAISVKSYEFSLTVRRMCNGGNIVIEAHFGLYRSG